MSKISDPKIKEKIEKLRAEVEKHRTAYHVHDKPTISDALYDSLMSELGELEEKHPEFDDKLSPTKRVGGEILDGFVKFKHTIPQWSYDNVFNFPELEKWNERNLNILKKEKLTAAPTFFAELKIDGLKIVLYYKNGRLENAVTRGDGEVGEDVTANIKTIKTIPLILPEKINAVVIGELWMSKNEFDKINLERESLGLEIYKNPRNTAAGTIRQLDPKVVAERKLEFFAYDMEFIDTKENLKEQKEEIDFLNNLGFMTNKKSVFCENLNEVQKVYKKWNTDKRLKEPYGIDGLVVKINERSLFDILGYTAKSPRGGIAYKFEAQEAVSTLLSVTYQVGRTGVVTPVAELTPVELSGSTVKRATLHNYDEIERLGVKVGDKVSVKKAGDIIPQIFHVFMELRTGEEKKINRIKNCPACESVLVQDVKGDGVKIICLNPDCPAKKINKIIYFASRKCANIEDLGESTVSALYEAGYVMKISDIYKLTKDQVLSLEGFKDKSANNLINSIEKSKKISLATFIMGLSIGNVGEETSIDLAKYFKNINSFLKLEKQELDKIYGIGEKTVLEVLNFLKNPENKKEMLEILKYVEVLDYQNTNTSKRLENLRFVITGSFENISREEMEKKIKENSGSVQSAINAKTSFLIVGFDAGSKLEKAQKLNIRTIDISEFLKML